MRQRWQPHLLLSTVLRVCCAPRLTRVQVLNLQDELTLGVQRQVLEN